MKVQKLPGTQQSSTHFYLLVGKLPQSRFRGVLIVVLSLALISSVIALWDLLASHGF